MVGAVAAGVSEGGFGISDGGLVMEDSRVCRQSRSLRVGAEVLSLTAVS